MKKVVVTGIGIAAPGSVGKEEFWSNMREGRVFTGMLKAMDSKGIRCPVSAEIHEEGLLPYRKKIEEYMGEGLSRTEFLAVLATMIALEDSGISQDDLRMANIHVALGSTMGIEDSLLRKESEGLLENPNQSLIDRYAPINIVNTVKKYVEGTVCQGESGGEITVRMFMNACAAGNYAIGDAFDEIRQGSCSAAVAGGVDALSYLAIVGFNRLLSVTPDVCRPFDKNRRGIVVGEGAGILVLEEKENAIKRGAHIYGEVSGYGLGADGFHITTPDPKGKGAIKAMRRALEQAGISSEQVDYISAHGTGTAANDATEYVAACEVFGEHIPPMSSIKSMIGHTMGAASAIEAAACCLMLDRGELLPTANFVTPDEKCPVDCVPNQIRKAQLTHIMSNALAFGGNNSSIIFSKAEAPLQEKRNSAQENNQPPVFLFTHTIRKEEAEEYIERELPNINTGMMDIQSLMMTAAIHRGMKENNISGLPEEATAIVSGSHDAAILSSIHFLRDVFKKGAIGASPMAFPNTVGNAPASRAAIWLDFRDKVVSLACEEQNAEADAIEYSKKLLESDSLYAFACHCTPNSVTVRLIGRGSKKYCKDQREDKRMNRAEKIITDKFITPFFPKSTKYIGIELELPICCLDRDVSTKEVGGRFLRLLMENHGFKQEITCFDGSLMRVVNESGDSVSFDYSYMLMEFSMARSETIKEVAMRFYTYVEIAQEFYKKENCLIVGMGTNFNASNVIEFTSDDFYITIRKYVEQYASQKDPQYIFPFMESVQTHIDVPGEDLLEYYNLFTKLDFARGLLFSNSLPNMRAIPPEWSYPENILCARDFNWSNCGLPNTGIAEKDFLSIEALVEYLSHQKIFINAREGKLNFFEPVSLSEYFSNEDNPEDDIFCYRSFERVVVNNFSHLEVRGDCMQPIREAFAPTAFNVGIAYNFAESKEVTAKFLSDNNITEGNSVLREKAITSQPICDDESMVKFLVDLIDCAKQGLLNRGYGEEIYLTPLYKRAETLSCPAKRQLYLLKNGVSMEDIILENSRLK